MEGKARMTEKLTTTGAALTVCFTALYVVFGLISISPIIGLSGRAMTAAAIIAPIIGILLGPYVGVLSTALGGLIGFSIGVFSPPSIVSGATAAAFAGMLYTGKRSLSIFAYFSLLFLFGFYPFVGPVWLFPLSLWFQIIGFLILLSPLQSNFIKVINSNSSSKLFPALFTIALTSTLAGQIAGSLALELISWPIFLADLNAWTGIWQATALLYPLERTIIALVATLIGAPLIKILKTTNMIPSSRAKN